MQLYKQSAAASGVRAGSQRRALVCNAQAKRNAQPSILSRRATLLGGFAALFGLGSSLNTKQAKAEEFVAEPAVAEEEVGHFLAVHARTICELGPICVCKCTAPWNHTTGTLHCT